MNENRVALIPVIETNEELLRLLQELKENQFHNVVVYYGVNEEDKLFLQKLIYNAKIMILTSRQGRGNAIKAGLKYIKEKYRSNTLIVTMSKDNSHSVKDVVRLCNECMIHQDTFFLGKTKELTSLTDKVSNVFNKTLYRISSGENITTTTTTLRAFSYNFIDFLLTIKGEKEDYEANVLFSCASHKVKIKEIDLTFQEENNEKKEIVESNNKDWLKENTQKLKSTKLFFMGYIVDYLLFLFLNFFAENHLIITNTFSRIISSIFTMNKQKVHKTDLEKYYKEFLTKTLVLLIIEILLLLLFVKIIHLPIFIAKLFSEVLYVLFDYGTEEYILKEKQ